MFICDRQLPPYGLMNWAGADPGAFRNIDFHDSCVSSQRKPLTILFNILLFLCHIEISFAKLYEKKRMGQRTELCGAPLREPRPTSIIRPLRKLSINLSGYPPTPQINNNINANNVFGFLGLKFGPFLTDNSMLLEHAIYNV